MLAIVSAYVETREAPPWAELCWLLDDLFLWPKATAP